MKYITNPATMNAIRGVESLVTSIKEELTSFLNMDLVYNVTSGSTDYQDEEHYK